MGHGRALSASTSCSALPFDEEYGGTGTGALMVLVAIEEISKVCATSGLILAVQELGSLGIKLAGTDGAEAALPAAARERRVARRLRAHRAGLGLRLGGDAHRGRASTATSTSSTARSASSRTPASRTLYTVFAKTDPEAGHAGISAFVVEADAPGFEVGRIEPKMGIKGSTTGEIFFNDCRIPADNLLGEEGEGFRIAMRILDRSRPGIAAQGLGIAQGATDYALEYARTRETMGKPIAQHQLIAAMLADMETKCEAARGLLYKCGQMIDEGAPTDELTKISRDGEALLHRRRDGGHDRRRPGARRLRLHPGVPGRADDARREDHADLRGHEPDPAARDRARDAEGEPRVPAGRRRLRRGAAGRPPRVRLTSADRVLFPDDGITKGDLVDYYAEVAPALVPHLRDRPFTMKRWREGLPGAGFFQKQAPKGKPVVDPDAPVPDLAARGRLPARRLPARQLARGARCGWCRCTAST